MAAPSLSLPRYSMFQKTPVYRLGDHLRFGLRRQALLPHASDVIYEVPPAAVGRIWLVAELFLGTPELWWTIAELNQLADPLTDVKPGTRLRVPTRERLTDEGVYSS